VHEHAGGALGEVVEGIGDGAVVLIDGLIASASPEVLVAQAERLRLVPLVHMPLRDRAVLSGAAAVVTTSAWTRRCLLELRALPADRVHVAEPGVDPADVATGTASGESLLCVAAVIRAKGHDVLLDALAEITDLSCRCVCVGSLDREPQFVASLPRRASFAGPRTGADLERSYAAADLLVLPSRAEAYGMVVTEALARGVPVVASDVGGVGEALGHGTDGARPGLLVPPGDPAALAAALRRWLSDAALRERLRRAARERRESLRPWSATASEVAGVLAEVALSPA
jgi:glycosyltransferase involved in cell wall biosynthesis